VRRRDGLDLLGAMVEKSQILVMLFKLHYRKIVSLGESTHLVVITFADRP
jgi:hypothetical protein